MRFKFAFFIVGYYAFIVEANTEIANFEVAPAKSDTPPLPLILNWPSLHSASREWKFALSPTEHGVATACDNDHLSPSTNHCPHQLWIVCDLNSPEWQAVSTFSLRLSWPASQPARFDIAVFTDAELFDQTAGSRVRYALITARKDSVHTPNVRPKESDTAVVFHLVLEPLYYGFLPASLIPLLWLVIPVLIVAYLLAQKVDEYLRTLLNTKNHIT